MPEILALGGWGRKIMMLKSVQAIKMLLGYVEECWYYTEDKEQKFLYIIFVKFDLAT